MKALLVFCEGPHDIAFVRLVLKHYFGFKALKVKFSEYPSPFNDLFKNAVTKHAASDLSLDMAHKFFLPDRVLRRSESLVMLFNAGGKNRGDKVKPFLEDLKVLQPVAGIFGAEGAAVTEVRYLFVYDADHLGVDKTLEMISNEFSQISSEQWLSPEWNREPGCFGAIHKVDKRAAAYVWRNAETDCGTLEDLLLECLPGNTTFATAKGLLEGMFSWETSVDNREIAVAEAARLMKASIAVLGQREKPGGSMNVIVDQTGIVTEGTAFNSDSIRAFADFFTKFSDEAQLEKAAK